MTKRVENVVLHERGAEAEKPHDLDSHTPLRTALSYPAVRAEAVSAGSLSVVGKAWLIFTFVRPERLPLESDPT
jgi:hypothetical protein